MVRLRKPVPDYTSRRVQWRLLLLVAAFGLVVLLFEKLRDSQTAQRMDAVFALDATQQQSSSNPQPEVARVHTSASAGGPQLFPGISADLLPTIQDNTYFRNAESAAWFHFIGTLQRADAEDLAGRSVAVDYTQLIDQPTAYRGKLVTVRGVVREVTEQQPATNELGLEKYYRVVMQPADGVNWPIIVYCLEQPPAGVVSADEAPPTAITGLFFKKLSYRSADGLGTAPVLLAKTVDMHTGADSRVITEDQLGSASINMEENGTKTATDVIRSSQDNSSGPGLPFGAMMKGVGWGRERLSKLDDGKPVSKEQRGELLNLLWRLRTFNTADLSDWARHGPKLAEVQSGAVSPGPFLVRLDGQLQKVTKHVLPPADAERLEMPEYFECELALADNAQAAIVLTTRIPPAWLKMASLDEPVSAPAMCVKRLPGDKGQPTFLWLVKHFEWYPTRPKHNFVSLGESVLGQLGMDVNLLFDVQNHQPIRGIEREPFYRMLGAVARIGPDQLGRIAQTNIDSYKQAWLGELTSPNQQRRLLANAVVQQADKGLYSVAPLFNDAHNQVGQLFIFDGVARRAVRVAVSPPFVCPPTDVLHSVTIDHYYEIEVFTDDSQNYPLVFCVRELPDGFPLGSSIDVPVRAAGFFFKSWLYRSRGSQNANESAGDSSSARQLYAPLLIGRAPVVLPVEQVGSDIALFIGGGLFVLALLSIAAAAAWTARGDQRFRERTLARSFSLSPGRSFDELQPSAANEPMEE